MRKGLFLLIMVVLSQAQILAQEGLIFKHITSDDGLSHNTVHAIYKDKYGFMWFGTESGLNKYDGKHFTIYYNDPKDPTSVGSDHIVAIGEDSYGNMWFGSNYYGISRYDRKQDVFENYTNNRNNPSSISCNNIRAIFEDSQKNLWIATTGGGINLYDRKINGFKRILYNPQNPDGIGSNYITSIAEDSKGNIWFGSSEIKLCRYSLKEKKFTNFSYKHNYNLNLNTDISYKICIDSDNDIWLTSEIGLLKFNTSTNKFSNYTTTSPGFLLNSNITTSLIEYRKGILFVLTDHGGINILNKHTGQIKYAQKNKTDPNSLSNNQLYSIFKTKQGELWIGSFFGGVNIFNEESIKFQKLQNLTLNNNGNNPSNSVLAVCEDANGDIWIGCDGQGVQIFNPTFGNLLNFEQYSRGCELLKGKAVTDIVKDKEKNIWIGTYQWGLYKYDWKSKILYPFDYGFGIGPGVSEKNIKTIALDNSDNIYIGTMSKGLICYNLKNKAFKQFQYRREYEKGLSNGAVFKILISKDKRVWIGLYTGLNLFDPKRGKFTWFSNSQNKNFSLLGNSINDIYQDEKDNLWLGTDQGLSLFRPDKNDFVQVLNRDQIKARNLFGINVDKFQNLWLSTDNGIVKYNISDKTVELYSLKDGLQGKDFSVHSATSDSKGFLYFGGSKGLTIFKPEKIRKNPLPPPVFITGLKVSHEYVTNKTHPEYYSGHINFAKEINLTYKENNISLEFVALSFSNPELSQYAYKLEGFDNNWNFIGTKNEITFTNLNPGEYTLRIKGSNSDGTWNEKGAIIKILVSPPFWNTAWFKVIAIFFIILLFITFYYIRISQIKAHNKLLKKEVHKRTIELNNNNQLLEEQANTLSETNTLLEEKQLQIEEQAKELIIQRDELYELNRLKDKLFSIIAYDLRSPFSSLMGLTKLFIARYNQYTNEKKLFTFTIINESLRSIYNLLENLLSWSRVQRGFIDFNPHETNLVELIKNNIKLFENQIVNKEITLYEEFEKSPYYIVIDNDLINTVIRNLLSNAIKYTEKNGTIVVGFCTLENKTKVWIRDNGVGISPENLKKLFKKDSFSTPGTNNEKGTGLGLFLCKEFVEKHKGDLWIESHPGEGSSFYFTLPGKEVIHNK